MFRKYYNIVMILTVTLTLPAFASNGTQIGTVGAKATAMGSNFIGLANDWSAMFFNPAGLSQLKGKWNIGTSIGFIMPSAEFMPHEYSYLPFSGVNPINTEATKQTFYIPAGAVYYRVTESLVVGLGVYTPFGLGTEWDLLTLPASYGNKLTKEKEHYSDHQVISIQPTIAYQVSDDISVGFGISYITGEMIINNVKLPISPGVPNWAVLQERADLLGLALTDLTPDQNRIAIENNLDGSGSAIGFNFGLHFKLSNFLTLGIAGKYYTDLNLKGSAKQTLISHADPVKIGTLNQVPAEFYNFDNGLSGEENKEALLDAFSGQDIIMTDTKNAKVDLPLPMTIGLGLAWQITPKFLLATDFSFTNWAVWNEIPIKANGEEIGDFLLNWENTIQAGFGFDYLILERESTNLFWRAGFYTVNSPAPDETKIPTILDPNRRFVFTTGFGLNVAYLRLDLAYEYTSFKNKDVADYNYNGSKGYAENWAGRYKAQSHVITFAASLRLF